MNLPDLKQLDKIIALCRKRGVASIEIDGVKVTLLNDLPQKTPRKVSHKASSSPVGASSAFDVQDELTDEQKLFWSSGIEMPEDSA